VFRLASRVSEHLNENCMLVTEKVFGFLLAALAVHPSRRAVRPRSDPSDLALSGRAASQCVAAAS
jgi:hypothetical protein